MSEGRTKKTLLLDPFYKIPFVFLRRERDFEMVWDREREAKLFVKKILVNSCHTRFLRTGDWVDLAWTPIKEISFFLVGCIADILLQLAWPRPLIWVCVMDNSHYLDECALFPSFSSWIFTKVAVGLCVDLFVFWGVGKRIYHNFWPYISPQTFY